MKRIVGSLLLFSLPIAASAFQAEPIAPAAESPGISISAAASAGTLNGEAKEHVFDYETADGSRRQLSRLDWDLKQIGMAGGQISARVAPKLTINGGLWLALTEGSGEMDDYDWLDLSSTEPTHYSLSEVDVTEGYAFDLNLAYDLVRRDGVIFSALAGYKQNGWTWSDRGVYLLYPEYGPYPIYLNGENLIDYEQEFKMPYIGASADFALTGFLLSAYVTYSPMVEATDWDHHIARTIKFKDTFEDGDMIGAGAEFRYPFKPTVFVIGAIDYQVIDLIVGDMEAYDYSTGETFFGEGAAGIENEYVAVTFGVGCHF